MTTRESQLALKSKREHSPKVCRNIETCELTDNGRWIPDGWPILHQRVRLESGAGGRSIPVAAEHERDLLRYAGGRRLSILCPFLVAKLSLLDVGELSVNFCPI